LWLRDGLLHGGNDVDRAEGGGVHGGGDSLLPRLPQPCLQVTSVPKAIDLSPPLSLLLSPALSCFAVKPGLAIKNPPKKTHPKKPPKKPTKNFFFLIFYFL
jgi:hypothetical protein